MQNNARHKFSEQANLYKAKPQMASGVFGTPITVETLQAIGLTAPTQKDVADYAMKMMNAGGKDTNAQNFVDNLKKKCGDAYSTECLIYNATGTTLYLDTYHDWHGHIYTSPYPPVIQNGQWGAYLHVCGFLVGSAGAVVYRSKVPSGGDLCDWLFSWSIPLIGDNGVYTEIREEGHFPKYWNYIYHNKLEKSGRCSSDKQYGYFSSTEIGEGTTATACAIFRLPYY
ncbi:unnamed protein product [Urochloa decumbens]|uniref:Uncharacterized protein n=1 Tax=Urochloa decumbens TaxID=240449 RepID=A0ABC9GGK9_9POAL